MQGKDDSAFAPSYEADPGSIPVGAPYASYPVAQEGDGGYQEPPFSGSQTRGVYRVVWLITQSVECIALQRMLLLACQRLAYNALFISGVPRGGDLGCSNPPPEIRKALQNRAKPKPTVKSVKNC